MSALSDLSAALLPPDAGGPDPHRVASAARILLDGMPARQRVGVGVGLAAIQAAAVATRGKRLGALSSQEQSAFLEGIATSGPLGSAAMDALKTLVLMGAGGDEFAPEIRSVGSLHPPSRPDPPLNIRHADELYLRRPTSIAPVRHTRISSRSSLFRVAIPETKRTAASRRTMA
jgi:hypothetical protein